MSDLYRKYGSVHRQLRALTVLDGLMQNAGSRFQRAFADEPLLERLRVAATDSLSDPEVKNKCSVLFRQWAVSYKSTPGMERIASLHKQLPQRKKPIRQEQSKVIRETEEDDSDPFGQSASVVGGGGTAHVRSPTSPTSSSSQSESLSLEPSLVTPSKNTLEKTKKKSKSKPFNLEKEKPQLLQTIASSSVASTNLMNALKLINREHKRVSEDADAIKRFETCKLLRRQILRYIQYIESEQWLGSLIHANEELVNALMTFEVMDKSVDDDSDSDEESLNISSPSSKRKSTQEAFAGLSLAHEPMSPARPPRPSHFPMSPTNEKGKQASSQIEHGEQNEAEEEDEDDPFADSNAVHTPKAERPGMTW